jgi:hypothetical protein
MCPSSVPKVWLWEGHKRTQFVDVLVLLFVFLDRFSYSLIYIVLDSPMKLVGNCGYS